MSPNIQQGIWNMLKNKAIQNFILLSSLVAVAALNYTILHNSFVFVLTFILLVHELGHYFAARRNGIKSRLPFFIPLPFFPIGVTITENAGQKIRKHISISGPLAAALALLILLFFNIHYRVFSFYALLIALVGEIVINYIGLDGQRYRGQILNKKIHANQHIEPKSSKEKLWKEVLKNPYSKMDLVQPLKIS